MYKPFVTCDDPKGVVECGTIMRYRTMKDKSKSRRPAENLQASLTNKSDKEKKASKGSNVRDFDPSSLQLVEVSRGAEKLNNMIESWSRGLRYDGKSEDIAKDLLKGALDLQESLEMLRKVQEASHNMARSKRKQDEKRVDAKVMMDRTRPMCSNQFDEQNYSIGVQREELKKVIKESLVRQNLFPSTSYEGLDSASASAFPSTSSSQSSVVWYDKLSDSSLSPNIPKKERGSTNLVAKLMGLEQVPSRSFPSIMQKQLESSKIVNQKRPVFEIDMPKIRKHSSLVEKVNPQRPKTLREILETTHFNGMLKNSSPVRDHTLHVEHSDDLHYEHFDDLPPIVLMKPRYGSYQERAKTYEQVPQEELSFRNLKEKEVSSKTFKPREGSTTNMRKEMEEHLSKRLEKPKRIKEVVEFDVKEIKLVENEKASRGKTETVDRKVKVKTITVRRKPLEKEVSKTKVVTKAQEQVGISSSSEKSRKPRSVSRIDKNEIPYRKSTASNSNTIPKPKTQKIINSREQKKSQMKKQRSIDEAEVAKPFDEQLRHEEAKSIDVSCNDDCAEIKIITTIAEDLTTMDHEVDTYANNKTRDNSEEGQNSSCDEVLKLTCEHENDAVPTVEARDTASIDETDLKHDKESSELKYLLLTSKSFINHAEELLNLDIDYPKIQPKIETNGISNNTKLYLDCANELTLRKSLQESQTLHPLLLKCVGNSRLRISLGSLVEEVYDAIENLTSYSENSESKLILDNVCEMLDRDLKCNNRVMNGIWNFGWRHGFSCDEVEHVVNEVEIMVLGGLIEDVIVNL